MLSPQLRSQVFKLWTLFWSAGMSNPLTAIEQITYLLFLRQLERLDRERLERQRKAGVEEPLSIYPDGVKDERRWRNFRDLPPQGLPKLLGDKVFPWLRELEKLLKEQDLRISATIEAKKTGKTIKQVLKEWKDDAAKSRKSVNDDPLLDLSNRLEDAYFVLDRNKHGTLAEAVAIIERLFAGLDSNSGNYDLMGDIFEYLLDEIETSGKTGQFRTPRHIIRFMIDMLDPELESGEGASRHLTRVLDPACGSAGFLINTLLHWRVETSDAKSIRWEWDGTPHHAFGGSEFKPEKLAPALTGGDNDRTMVRIAWMNLILHELPYPRVFQRDALSKSNNDPGGYDFILANPPFTGTVDKSDFHERFEHGDESTTKSELLFLWLILDQLRKGGRAAVIVPDGVLFGSTKAHQRLRRELLFKHELQAVISLPGGVFLPYAGVKTSILIFQKVGETRPNGDPRTDEVFFYEVEDEARTLNQKRDPRPGQWNDLWDAEKKFRAWHQCLTGEGSAQKRKEARDLAASPKAYFQPRYWRERWRFVDDTFCRLYPEAAKRVIKDYAWPLHDLFPGCPSNPDEAERKVIEQETPRLHRLLTLRALDALKDLKQTPEDRRHANSAEHVQKSFDGLARNLLRTLARRPTGEQDWLDRDSQSGQFGLNALRRAFDQIAAEIRKELPVWIKKAPAKPRTTGEEVETQSLLRSFGQLDGFDVWCQDRDFRDISPRKMKEVELSPEVKARSWVVKVREWAKFEDWGGADAKGKPPQQPTHNEKGLVRADYLADLRKRGAFADNGVVTESFRDRLEPGCIEETGFILSAGRYKPFDLTPGTHRPPKTILSELQKLHEKLGGKLRHLVDLVEDRK
jgi:type I restriction enzyme M protein